MEISLQGKSYFVIFVCRSATSENEFTEINLTDKDWAGYDEEGVLLST